MKKISLILLLMIFVTGCTIKNNLSSNDFIDIMEDNNYYVTSLKSEYKNYEEIEEVYIAQSRDMTYQIEFYEFTSISAAKKCFNSNKKTFQKETNIENNNKEEFNYTKYYQITNSNYQVISRIDNTVVYVNADKKYKEKIDKILDKINY